MNKPHFIPWKTEKFPPPYRVTMCTLRHNIGVYCTFRTANNAIATYIHTLYNEIHNICIRNDKHNKTVCYIQQICKELNFHNGMKSTVTCKHTPMLRSVFLSSKEHTKTCTNEMKSLTKHCSLQYTYSTNRSSTTKMK
jgi:hypothetical protein